MNSIPKTEISGDKFYCVNTKFIVAKTGETRHSGGFDECPYDVPINKERQIKIINNCKGVYKYSIPDCSIGELKKHFKKEFNSFHAVRYDRTGKNGKYEMHPNIETFPRFLAAFGPIPVEGWTLDRIDPNDILYSAGNCVWRSKTHQSENRSNRRNLTDDTGLTLSASEWFRRTGIARQTILNRVNSLNWSEHDAVHVPVGESQKTKKLSKPDIQTKNSNQKSPVATYMSPATNELLAIFLAAREKSDNGQFFVPTKTDLKRLKEVRKILEAGKLDAVKVLSFVTSNWIRYTKFAKQVSGAYGLPTIPTINFMRNFVNDMGCFFLSETGESLRTPISKSTSKIFPLATPAHPTKEPEAPKDPPTTLEELKALFGRFG